tara:strand:- start:161 stop:373 length:213 start_codon:yes stop_codon:yes gene_type:complete
MGFELGDPTMEAEKEGSFFLLLVKDVFIKEEDFINVVGIANEFAVLFRFVTAAFKLASFFAFTFLMYSFK